MITIFLLSFLPVSPWPNSYTPTSFPTSYLFPKWSWKCFWYSTESNLCCPYRHKFNVISICMINIAELTPLQQKLDSPFLTSLQLSMLPLLGMWPLSASSFMIQCWLIIFAHLFQASIGTVSPWKLLCSKDTV